MALTADAPDLDLGGGPMLEIDLLKTLVAIVSTGSFNRAARAVYRTPSAVSMQMKKLEDLIGRPVFAKDGRGVTLTGDGEELLGYARRMLQLNDEALARFRCAPTEGAVRIGTPDDYATRFLPAILGRFAASHPLVQVDVSCLQSSQLNRLLEDDEIDIALVSIGHTLPGQTLGTIVHREPLVWGGVRHGRAYQKRPLPVAVSNSPCCWRNQALGRLDRNGIPYRIAYTSQHYVGQIAPVLADLAVTPLPLSVLSEELVRIDERELPFIGHYEIEMRRSARATGPAIDALADHIQQSFMAEARAA